MLRILLVDDEPSIRLTVGDALEAAGHSVEIAEDGQEALDRLKLQRFDTVISDIRLPKADGYEIFESILASGADTDVILMTAYAEVQEAVEALKRGARDYLTKPFDTAELVLRVARIHAERRTRDDLRAAREALAGAESESSLVGTSNAITKIHSQIEMIAESEAPVLILGESGTGKELVAREIHKRGGRAGAPFVAVNCAAFPETLLEAELFGHERGAFTGAVRQRPGRFRNASGGTLFLDEIAEISPTAQAKLLRVLQEGVVEPLGSDTPVEVDVRVLSATHRNLKQRIKTGEFREDLYYRINVLDVSLPPLRERRDDLPLLTEHFLHQLSRDTPPAIAPDAWAALAGYEFPGNVRELRHAIERALVLSRQKEIRLEHLPEQVVGIRETCASHESDIEPLNTALKRFEREYICRTLDRAGGKKTRAAELLQISRKNLWEKMRSLGLSDPA